MDELTALTQRNMQSLHASSESETVEQTKARQVFMAQLFARFEAASGKPLDIDGKNTRKLALINELNLRRYSEHEAKIAQEWILRGNPVRFGSLTLADFFPGPDELASVGFNLATELRKAEHAGVDKGYHMGYSEARKAIQPKEEKPKEAILTPLSDTERIEYEYLKGKVSDLEAINTRLNQKLLEIEKRSRRGERATADAFRIPASYPPAQEIYP